MHDGKVGCMCALCSSLRQSLENHLTMTYKCNQNKLFFEKPCKSLIELYCMSELVLIWEKVNSALVFLKGINILF